MDLYIREMFPLVSPPPPKNSTKLHKKCKKTLKRSSRCSVKPFISPRWQAGSIVDRHNSHLTRLEGALHFSLRSCKGGCSILTRRDTSDDNVGVLTYNPTRQISVNIYPNQTNTCKHIPPTRQIPIQLKIFVGVPENQETKLKLTG